MRILLRASVALALCSILPAYAQSAPSSPEAPPWQGLESDQANLRIHLRLLYVPEGIQSDGLLLSGEVLSYRYSSSTMVVLGATPECADSVRSTPGGRVIAAPVVAVTAGSEAKVRMGERMPWQVPADDTPDGFGLHPDEWGVSLSACPIFNRESGDLKLFMSVQARTPVDNPETGAREIEQLDLKWFILPLQLGAENLVMLPPAPTVDASGAPDAADAQPDAPTPREPLGPMRYVLFVRVTEAGTTGGQPQWISADYPQFFVGSTPATGATVTGGGDVHALLQAIQERTGVGVYLDGDNITPAGVRDGYVKVLMRLPNEGPMDHLALDVIRLKDLLRGIGLPANGGLADMTWTQLSSGTTEERRAQAEAAIESLESAAAELDDLIAKLRAELATMDEARDATDPPPGNTPDTVLF